MTEGDRPAPGHATAKPGSGAGEPRRNWLRRIIEQGPEARRRLGDAVAGLLGTALISLAVIVGLVVWHLIRRGRLLRDRLGPPRVARMSEFPDLEGDPHDQDHDEASTS
jgi:hypothetical protein